MLTKDFSFEYPPELIAKNPLPHRAQSRMMILSRSWKTIAHGHFLDFPNYLNPGDLLIFNNTKVIPARLFATKPTGGKVEILLIRSLGSEKNSWECLVKPATGIEKGSKIFFRLEEERIPAVFQEVEQKIKTLQFPPGFSVLDLMRKTGGAPLPPYIGRKENHLIDLERYQTIFAEKEGAIAAPTAGLHFTPEILVQLREKGVQIHFITLHVGLGTFEPVRTEKVEDHRMHEEFYEVPDETTEAIQLAKKENRPITAIGTTTVRGLESCFLGKRHSTNLFIYPGYQFKIVDRLFTNFHQPESTLIMLTSAFAGKEFLFESYKEAIKERYRLFSYGDCMLIV